MVTLSDLAREAQASLDSFEYGVHNPDALTYFQGLEARMRAVPYCHADMKIASMRAWAAILYSDRKHRDFERGSTSGADRVRSFLFEDLEGMITIERMYQCTASASQ